MGVKSFFIFSLENSFLLLTGSRNAKGTATSLKQFILLVGEKKRKRETEATDQREDYKTSAEELLEVIKRVKERLENIDSRLHRLETLVTTNMASSGQSLDRIGELVEPFLGVGERERKRAGEEEEEEDADVNDLRNSPRFRPMVRKSEE